MKQTIQLVLICLAFLSACQSAPAIPTEPVTIDTQPDALPVAAPTIARTTLNNQSVTVSIPPGWNALATDNAILYTEMHHSFAAVGHLEGISVSIFAPSSDELARHGELVMQASNPAHTLLSLVVNEGHHVASGHATVPTAFQWQGHEAAYYTASSGAGVITVLLAVSISQDTLLVMNVSAPATERQRVRQQLPAILSSITIEEHTLKGEHLNALPAVLRFPAEDLNVAGN
ncbi:MAG: hypothetical protein AAF787_06580 [Chloroflexota bacterium]